jgi:hypothetical protein
VLARRLRRDWRRHLVLVRPETVVRWHRRAWRLFWRWRSRTRLGRPRRSPEVRALLAAMARDNPRWGTERIRGELLKLGLAVSNRSVRRYRGRRPTRPPSQTWRAFLRNHAGRIWAADLFTVPTVTFRRLYVLFFISYDRRELAHFRETAHPTAAWVWRQLSEVTARRRQPTYLLRDRDSVYGRDFLTKARQLGIDTLLTPYRAPRAKGDASYCTSSDGIVTSCGIRPRGELALPLGRRGRAGWLVEAAPVVIVPLGPEEPVAAPQLDRRWADAQPVGHLVHGQEAGATQAGVAAGQGVGAAEVGHEARREGGALARVVPGGGGRGPGGDRRRRSAPARRRSPPRPPAGCPR